MSLENLKLGEILPLLSLLSGNTDATSFILGKSYLIRTVTHISVGRVKQISSQEILLEDASWIADTGRFHDALKNGIETLSSSEVEPFVDDVVIGRGAIIDATEYRHALPRDQK